MRAANGGRMRVVGWTRLSLYKETAIRPRLKSHTERLKVGTYYHRSYNDYACIGSFFLLLVLCLLYRRIMPFYCPPTICLAKFTSHMPRTSNIRSITHLHTPSPSTNTVPHSSSCESGISSSPGAPPLYSLLVIGYATLDSFSFCSSKSSVVAVAASLSSHSVASLMASRSCWVY